jgi:hypothetical protein
VKEEERLSEENNHHKIAPTSMHMVFLWQEKKKNIKTTQTKTTQSAC